MALIDDLRNKLTNVADAIREKNGGSDKIKIDDMPDAIRNISSGGTTGSITKLQMAKITGLTSEVTVEPVTE